MLTCVRYSFLSCPRFSYFQFLNRERNGVDSSFHTNKQNKTLAVSMKMWRDVTANLSLVPRRSLLAHATWREISWRHRMAYLIRWRHNISHIFLRVSPWLFKLRVLGISFVNSLPAQISIPDNFMTMGAGNHGTHAKQSRRSWLWFLHGYEKMLKSWVTSQRKKLPEIWTIKRNQKFLLSL